MSVEKFSYDEGDLLVVEVVPHPFPPVKFKGKTWIRIGPRKDIATEAEERALKKRRQANLWSFETYPCKEATLDDLKLDLFKNIYLPAAIDEDVLVDDKRDIKDQMAALRLYSLKEDCPTYAAILLFGKRPEYYLPGAYVQYVRFKGEDNAADIVNEHKFSGCLLDILPKLDTFIETAIVEKSPKPISPLREKMVYNYPTWAVRELLMNAVMHRDYQSNTPIKFYQYQNRIEIDNAGGLYGNANKENFPNVNDYRNPVIAEAMKLLGYVNRYNRGIARVQKELRENGNGDATFSVANITVFEVNVAYAAYTVDDQLDIDYDNPKKSSKVASKVASKTPKRASRLSKEALYKDIIRTGVEYVSLEDIAVTTGKNRIYLKNKIIPRMVEQGLLERKYPDNPKHPNQQYRAKNTELKVAKLTK